MHLARRCIATLSLLLVLHAAGVRAQDLDIRSAPLGRTADGKTPTVAEHEGKVLIAFFWASWCPHCRSEMPVLENLQRKVPSAQLQVVAVNVEEADDFRRVRRALGDQFQMQLTHDADGASGRAFKRPDGIPYTVIFNRDGTVRATYSGWGESSLKRFVKDVNAALQSAP
jgi:thiol-disulfide isomerase/thioredoxin